MWVDEWPWLIGPMALFPKPAAEPILLDCCCGEPPPLPLLSNFFFSAVIMPEVLLLSHSLHFFSVT